MNIKVGHGVKRALAVLVAFLLFSSCSTEYKIASQAGKDINGTSLLLLFPDDIFVQNSKPYSFPDSLNEEQRYLLSLDSSFFLKDIDAEKFKEQFQNRIIKLYSEYGFKVYTEETLDSFLTCTTTAYILNFSQLQIEEFWKPFNDDFLKEDGTVYSQYFDLNALAAEAWVNVSKANDTSGIDNLIYCESVISDEIDGNFYYDEIDDKVYYTYNANLLEKDDWSDLLSQAPIDISLNIIDFIVNSSIEREMLSLENTYPNRFWRYNPGSTRLSPVHGKSDYVIMK